MIKQLDFEDLEEQHEMQSQTVIFATAEGKKGDIFLIRMAGNKSWYLLDGTPYKKKDLQIKEKFETSLSTLFARLNEYKEMTQ